MKYTMKQMAMLLCAGLFIAACGFGMAGFDYRNLSTKGVYEMNHFDTNAQSLRSILIQDKDARVVLTPSGDDQVYVEYDEREDERYTVSTDASGVLSIIYDAPRGINFLTHLFELDWNVRTLTVAIPANSNLPVNASTTNGTIVANGLTLGNLSLKTSNGKIEARDLTAPAIDITTSNGRLSLERLAATTNLSAQTSNGRMELSHITAQTIVTRTSNASVTLNDVHATGRIDATSSNGRMTLDGVTAPVVKTHTSNASIRLNAVDAQSLDIKSGNGSIHAALAGSQADYTITSSTINGKNNLPSGGSGSRTLTIKTSNASINVTFAAR